MPPHAFKPACSVASLAILTVVRDSNWADIEWCHEIRPIARLTIEQQEKEL
jgi:hypothetical protein